MNYRILYLIGVGVALAAVFRLLGLYFVGEHSPLGVLAFLFVGLVAGWLVGHLMRRQVYGILGDIVVGVTGALLGGLLFSVLTPEVSYSLIGAIVVAFAGACLFIALVQALPPPSPVEPSPRSRRSTDTAT
jgi:uncharacterized membrane protein YeaQ/YmgE (transglycosylase-associated protein family)